MGERCRLEPQWRRRWQAARWFLTADGDADYPLGNGTIVAHPQEGWLELKLPAPLGHLANRPSGRYRLSCPVTFSYRADAWAAQVASGAVCYDIAHQPERDRWYLDAAWTHPRRAVPTLAELAGGPRVAVDSTPVIWTARCWTRRATRSAPRRPSRSTSMGPAQRPGTGGCGPRSAS